MMLSLEVPASIVSKWEEFKFYATPPISWYQYRPDPVAVRTLGLGLFVLCIWALAFYLGRETASTRTRTRQMRAEREKDVKSLIGDAVTDAIEDLVYKHKLKRDEAGFWYRRLGHILTLPDILAKNTKTLKDQLKEKHKGKTNVVPIKKKVGQFLSK
jgi:hypothetical protein